MTVFRSPWQNPFVERLIGATRRDCLDHVIVVNAKHLKRILSSYLAYYHHDRTHYGLGKDTPVECLVQPMPAKGGKIIELPGSVDCVTATSGDRAVSHKCREFNFCE